jgi:hypothetical protein
MKGIQTSLIKWNVAALVTPTYIIREGYGQEER